MPPREVSHVKQWRSPRRAAVHDVEYRGEVAVQVDDRRYDAVKLERLSTAVPPAVRGAHRQSHEASLFDANLDAVHHRGERAGNDGPFLVLLEVNVQGWTVVVRWERALQFQAHLAVPAHAAHAQAFARMTVVQRQPAVPCPDGVVQGHPYPRAPASRYLLH